MIAGFGSRITTIPVAPLFLRAVAKRAYPMLSSDILKLLTKGAGRIFDFTGSYNNDLYNKYLQKNSLEIDAENLATDWKSIDTGILNAILQLALEDENFRNDLLNLFEIYENKEIINEKQSPR